MKTIFEKDVFRTHRRIWRRRVLSCKSGPALPFSRENRIELAQGLACVFLALALLPACYVLLYGFFGPD